METETVRRKVHVIQRPPKPEHFDLAALTELGEVNWLAPSAPNILDSGRLREDFERMLKAISEAGPDDVFVALGGSPISNWIFGAALYASGASSVNVAMYSRDIDGDGRRKDAGSYRVLRMPTEFPEAA